MYTYALMVFLVKHYCFRKQQLWHRVKPLNWPLPAPFPFPQHLPARCLSPLQRRSRLAALGCFWCFPSHLLLFPFSCMSAGSDFALHRHRGCPQRNRLFILGAAQPPLGSLPAAGIFFARKRVLLPSGNKCQVASLSPPWAASFICSKTNWDQEGTYMNDRLPATFFPPKIHAQASVFQACWLQS